MRPRNLLGPSLRHWVRCLAEQLGDGLLHAHDDGDLEKLSPTHASALARLRSEFRELSAIEPDESLALVLRFASAPATSVRSQRRAAVASSLLA